MKTGLWTKVSKKGVSYAVGKMKIENKEYRIVLFKNNDKKTDKSPDFNITVEEIIEKNSLSEEEFAEFGEITEIKDEDLAF